MSGLNKFFPILFLFGLIYFVTVMSFLNWNYMPDDGYRYLHVVNNILQGYGVKWNAVDSNPSQSFTSFPWILFLVIASLVTNISLITLSKYIGILFFTISIIYIFRYLIRYSKYPIYSTLFISSALILSPPIFFHTVNGMETMLFYFFISLSTISFIKSLDSKANLTYTFVAFLITVFIRYESVIFCGFLTLFLMYKYRDEIPYFYSRFFSILIIPGLLYLLGVYLYFGNLLPNSFHVKTAATLISSSGYSYFIENYNNFFLGCSLAFLTIYPFSKNPNKNAYLVLFLAFHIQLLFILRIIPTVGQGGRFMFPYVIPLYLITINITISTVLDKLRKSRFINYFYKFFFIFLLIFSTHSYDRKDSLKYLISYSADRVFDPAIGQSLSNIKIDDPTKITIVGGESGAISFFSKFTFVDIWGLHDSFIAKNGLDNDYIFSYKPDIFLSFIHKDALIFNDKNEYVGLDYKFINFRINLDEFNKDIRGNTAYFSYLHMIDDRFKEMELIRTIDIGSGKTWVFFVSKESKFQNQLITAVNKIEWKSDQDLIISSMRPNKIIKALINPFNRENFVKVKVMFNE